MVSSKMSQLRAQKWMQYDPAYKWANPAGEDEILADCGVRAICLTEEIPYEDVEKELLEKLTEVGFRHKVEIYEIYLNEKYERIIIPKVKRGEPRVTLGEFVRTHPRGNYVMKAAGHLSASVQGVIYDTFYCADKTCYTAWKIKD